MKRSIFSSSMLTSLVVAVASLATNANAAAWSTTFTRAVCGSALVPGTGDTTANGGWTDAGGYYSYSNDGSSFGSVYHYGKFHIPIEDTTGGTSMAFHLRVYGGQGDTSQVCAEAYVYDSTGSFSVSTNNPCTSGVSASTQTLTMGTVTLPANGSAYINVAAQYLGAVYRADYNFTASGT